MQGRIQEGPGAAIAELGHHEAAAPVREHVPGRGPQARHHVVGHGQPGRAHHQPRGPGVAEAQHQPRLRGQHPQGLRLRFEHLEGADEGREGLPGGEGVHLHGEMVDLRNP